VRRHARLAARVLLALVLLAPAGLAAGTSCQGWNLDIDAAMDAAGVAPGMIVGEAGAGDGYFTLPMARRVGPAGAVYANDISRRALDSLAASARREGLPNIHTVDGAVDDPRFPRQDLALIVIVHAFHDFSQPVEWLINARKYLRQGGTIVIIDRDPSQGAESHFWTRERILGHAEHAGYEMTKIVDTISSHLIIVLRPRPATANRGMTNPGTTR
jgi:ubiquinone/menaquinone biosynthesis C-methylase UbiE